MFVQVPHHTELKQQNIDPSTVKSVSYFIHVHVMGAGAMAALARPDGVEPQRAATAAQLPGTARYGVSTAYGSAEFEWRRRDRSHRTIIGPCRHWKDDAREGRVPRRSSPSKIFRRRILVGVWPRAYRRPAHQISDGDAAPTGRQSPGSDQRAVERSPALARLR